jgi:hypothetical protein
MNTVFRLVGLTFTGLLLAACAYLPDVNTKRRVEVRDIVDVVECEIVAAVRALGPRVFRVGTWDVKSSLDLTLVNQIDADGKIVWTIPIMNTLTPAASLSHKTTSIAHVDFITLIRNAMKGPAGACVPNADPSGTGLGLAAWMETTFRAIGKESHGGFSYTSEFELTTIAGARFGFAFTSAPVTGEIGASGTRIGTNRLVVTVSPHVDSGPTEVVIVGDKTKVETKTSVGRSRRDQVLTNPLGNQMLMRQAPVRLQPGTTLRLQ